jgi:hypothetical protein
MPIVNLFHIKADEIRQRMWTGFLGLKTQVIVNSCEHCNGYSCFIKGRKFPDLV